MDKDVFIKLMNQYGDAVITYISPVSKREKFNVGTIDINNRYIQNKLRNSPITLDPTKVLTFCWDTDSARQIDPLTVVNVEPLVQEMERASASKKWRKNSKK